MNNNKTILAVDDTVENLDFLCAILRKQYRILTSSNGEDALILAEKETPDLILLDIEMPVMDGFQVCKALKANDKTKDIPIIFIFGIGSEPYRKECMQLGAVNYISKPFSLDNLRRTIEKNI